MDHRPNIRSDVDVDRKSRIGWTEVDAATVVDNPPAALAFWCVSALELNCNSAFAEDIRIDTPPDVASENGDVEIVFLERILGVMQLPLT
jgi:hypothetical protein